VTKIFNQTGSGDQKLLVTQYPFIELGNEKNLVIELNNSNFSIASQKHLVFAQKHLVFAQKCFGCYPKISII
jgi:hypothetical protein